MVRTQICSRIMLLLCYCYYVYLCKWHDMYIYRYTYMYNVCNYNMYISDRTCMDNLVWKRNPGLFRTCSGCLPRCNGLRCFFHWAIWPETAPSPVLIGPQLQCYTNSKQFVITWKFCCNIELFIRMRWTPSCQLLKFLCSYLFSVDLTPRHCGIEVLSSRVVLLLLVAKWRDCLQSLDPPVSWFLCCLGWENFSLRKGT